MATLEQVLNKLKEKSGFLEYVELSAQPNSKIRYFEFYYAETNKIVEVVSVGIHIDAEGIARLMTGDGPKIIDKLPTEYRDKFLEIRATSAKSRLVQYDAENELAIVEKYYIEDGRLALDVVRIMKDQDGKIVVG